VAVCLAGRLRALSRTLDLARSNFLAALQPGAAAGPDVFLYAPAPTSAEVAGLARLFEPPAAVRAARFDDEGYVLEALGRRHAAVLKKAMRIRGNWLGSTNREILPGSHDRRAGTGIFMMHAHEQCLEMIREREDRRGSPYGRVVFTRTDLRWIFPHPPLDLLSPAFAWIPDTGEDDWGGLYDKHLVLARAAADHALGGWRLLTSGRAYELVLGLVGEQALRGNDTNTELWLALRLLAAGVRVARFPMTAYVSCDPGQWVAEVDARVPMHELRKFQCSEERDGRYPLEFAAVARLAECLSLARSQAKLVAQWSRAAALRCYCGGQMPAVLEGDAFPDRWELCSR